MSSALARPKVSLRIRLAAANIEIMPAMVVQDGRVMWCHGRRVICFGDLANLATLAVYPRGADTACLSPSDYERISEDRE